MKGGGTPGGAMACQRCGIALRASLRQGVEVDYCPQCRGVWLDRGELEKLMEQNGADPWGSHQRFPYWQEGGSGGSDDLADVPERVGVRRRTYLDDVFDFDD